MIVRTCRIDGKPAIQLDQEPAIMVREPDATRQPTPHDNQLMSKHRVLSFKPQLRLEMARPGRPERNRAARSFGQLRRFHHVINSNKVFGTDPYLRLEWRGQDGQNETEQPDHSASLGDSITASTRIRFSVHTAVPQLMVRS